MGKKISLVPKLATLILLAFVPLQPVSSSNLVVVTSVDNLEPLRLEDIARIFLGKVTHFPGGEIVEPLNIAPSDPNFAEFARLALNKTPSQLKAYWARRVFTGKGKPPRSFKSIEELRALVASDKRFVSYVDKNDLDQSVRWVIELKPQKDSN